MYRQTTTTIELNYRSDSSRVLKKNDVSSIEKKNVLPKLLLNVRFVRLKESNRSNCTNRSPLNSSISFEQETHIYLWEREFLLFLSSTLLIPDQSNLSTDERIRCNRRSSIERYVRFVDTFDKHFLKEKLCQTSKMLIFVILPFFTFPGQCWTTVCPAIAFFQMILKWLSFLQWGPSKKI